jgi:hypothetical protein
VDDVCERVACNVVGIQNLSAHVRRVGMGVAG